MACHISQNLHLHARAHDTVILHLRSYIVAMLVVYGFNYLQTEMGQLLFKSYILLLPVYVRISKAIHYSYILPMK